MITHIVLFNPKPDIGIAEMRAFARSMSECFRGIGAIGRVNVGRSEAIDPGYARSFGDKTYEFAAVLEFKGAEELIAYLRHPMHDTLGRLFWEVCESTVVSEHAMIDGRDPNVDQFLFG